MTPGPLMIDVAGHALTAEERERIAHPNVGGVILFARNYQDRTQLAALCGAIRAIGRRPRLLAVDHEGGRVQRFRTGFTRIPAMGSIGAGYAEDAPAARRAARRAGRTIARELSAFGIDLCFAPVLDIDRGRSGVIGDRAFAAEPDAIVSLAGAFRRGLNEAGAVATGKHFPGHGHVRADSHLELPIDRRPLAELESDMRPFAAMIGRGLESVMMAHVLYPAVDERWPASLSPVWIRQILRRRLGFGGAVFCDDLSMNGARLIADPLVRLEQALAAGCDMVPVCNDPDTAAILIDGLTVKRRAAAARRLRRMYAHPTDTGTPT